MSTPEDLRDRNGGRRSPPRRRPPRVLIAGLGNELLRDDGVGVHAARLLADDAGGDLRVVAVGTAVLDALHLFEWADRILAIDAMQAGALPGTIYRFGPRDVLQPLTAASLHELSLVAALRFLSPGCSPAAVTILGVEPAVIDYGLELSPPVSAALPRLVDVSRHMVRGWREMRLAG